MTSKEMLKEIKTAIGNVKKGGNSVVSIDALEKYLNDFDGYVDTITEMSHDESLARFKSANDKAINDANMHHNSKLEEFKSVILAGQNSLKASLLINGAAAISLLAFLGKIWSESTDKSIAINLSSSVLLFSVGVLFVALASGTTYLAQVSFHRSDIKKGVRVNIISIALILLSYVLYFCGTYNAVDSIKSHFN